MLKKIHSYGLILSLMTLLILPVANVSAGNWNSSTRTERTKVADGVWIERKVNKKTGQVVSEVTLVQTPTGFFQGEKKADGSWGLSREGKAEQDAAQEAAATSGGGGGGSGGGGGGGGC